MMQGKRKENPVDLAHDLQLPDGIELRGDVGVTQRHALGRTGRARGVEKNGRVIRSDDWQFARFRTAEFFPTPLIVRRSIEQDEFSLRIELLEPGHATFGRDDGARRAIAEDVREIVVAKLDIERRYNRARSNRPERRRNPFRSVLGQEHDTVARFESCPRQPVGESAGTLGQFAIRPDSVRRPVEREERRFLALLA